MIEKRLTRTKHGEPVLTIRAVGSHDIYRLSHHLLEGQVDLAGVGRRSLRSLRRVLGRANFTWLQRYMHGDGGWS